MQQHCQEGMQCTAQDGGGVHANLTVRQPPRPDVLKQYYTVGFLDQELRQDTAANMLVPAGQVSQADAPESAL
eukprot:356761-Chlamydomonas_euryale.AAC.3